MASWLNTICFVAPCSIKSIASSANFDRPLQVAHEVMPHHHAATRQPSIRFVFVSFEFYPI